MLTPAQVAERLYKAILCDEKEVIFPYYWMFHTFIFELLPFDLKFYLSNYVNKTSFKDLTG
jgi:short-subunit dehydrogenase